MAPDASVAGQEGGFSIFPSFSPSSSLRSRSPTRNSVELRVGYCTRSEIQAEMHRKLQAVGGSDQSTAFEKKCGKEWALLMRRLAVGSPEV